jgi:hypothetical protein
MNERIKLLAKQAGATVNERSGWTDYGTIDLDVEKFAELIVGECCSKLKEMGESWHEFARNPPDGQAHNASGALFAAYRLKEDAVDEIRDHFGVEE